MNVCWLGSLYIISPMARISRNIIRPTPMYTKMMLGPVSAIDLPEPRNRPVPMVPPMAMNWTWRFFRPRSISLLWSRLSTDLMCAALEPAELVFSEVIMFTTLPREPHIAPAEALFLGTYADFAALTHPVCGQPCPADHLIPVFSPRHTPCRPISPIYGRFTRLTATFSLAYGITIVWVRWWRRFGRAVRRSRVPARRCGGPAA